MLVWVLFIVLGSADVHAAKKTAVVPPCRSLFDEDLLALGEAMTGKLPRILEQGLEREVVSCLGPRMKRDQTYMEYFLEQSEPEQTRILTQLALRVTLRAQSKEKSMTDLEKDAMSTYPLAVTHYVKALLPAVPSPELRPFKDEKHGIFDPRTEDEQRHFIQKMPEWVLRFHLQLVGEQWEIGALVRAKLVYFAGPVRILIDDLVSTFASRRADNPILVWARAKVVQACSSGSTLPPAHYWLVVDQKTLEECGEQFLRTIAGDGREVTLENRILALDFIYSKMRAMPITDIKNRLQKGLVDVFYGPSRWLYARAYAEGRMPPSLVDARQEFHLNY